MAAAPAQPPPSAAKITIHDVRLDKQSVTKAVAANAARRNATDCLYDYRVERDVPYSDAHGIYSMLDIYIPVPTAHPAPQQSTQRQCCPRASAQPNTTGVDAKSQPVTPSSPAVTAAPLLAGAAAGHAADAAPPAGGYPVLIFIPGGGWRQHGRLGPMGLYVGTGRSFAKRGFVTVLVSYRLRGGTFVALLPLYFTISIVITGLLLLGFHLTHTLSNTALICSVVIPISALCAWHAVGFSLHKHRAAHPAQIHDIAAAVKFVRENISQYGGDPNSMYIAGNSAGGHILGCATLEPAYLAEAGLPGGLTSANGIKGIAFLSAVYAPVGFLCINVFDDKDRKRCGPIRWLQDSLFAFFYPAFVAQLYDPPRRNRSFPLRIARDLGSEGIRHLKLPPVFMMTTTGEFGIDNGINQMAQNLLDGGVAVERITLVGADHGSYMFDMDVAGKPGEEVLAPILERFFLEHCPRAPGADVETALPHAKSKESAGTRDELAVHAAAIDDVARYGAAMLYASVRPDMPMPPAVGAAPAAAELEAASEAGDPATSIVVTPGHGVILGNPDNGAASRATSRPR